MTALRSCLVILPLTSAPLQTPNHVPFLRVLHSPTPPFTQRENELSAHAAALTGRSYSPQGVGDHLPNT